MQLWKSEIITIVLVILLGVVFFTAPELAKAKANSSFKNSNFAIKYDNEFSGVYASPSDGHSSAVMVDNGFSIIQRSSILFKFDMYYFSHLKGMESQFASIDFSEIKSWSVVATNNSLCATDVGISSITFQVKIGDTTTKFHYTKSSCIPIYSHPEFEEFLHIFYMYLNQLRDKATHSDTIRDWKYDFGMIGVCLISILGMVANRTIIQELRKSRK